MNLDNIGPIALFIVYMAISAWAKKNKARQKSNPKENPVVEAPSPISKPLQGVGGILDQLKKELFELDEEPLAFQQPMPEPELEEEIETPVSEPVPVQSPQYVEGSPPHSYDHLSATTVKIKKAAISGQTLEEVLEPYSKIEQGIILHEILGKPRARQKNDEWFHRS